MHPVDTHVSVQGHLRQRFSVLSSMAMAFAILNTWIALAGSIGLVLPSGGSTALLYGFIFCVLCNFALAASLGEMAAIWPTSGGQYHFVYALCTEKWRRSMSFLAGWANITGWLTVTTVQAFFAAQFISAAIVIATYDEYVITAPRTYGIFAATIVVGTVVNIFANKILEIWSKGALYWSVGGVIVISVVLLAMAQKTSADFVFTEFNNSTGWPDGMAWLLGLLQPALSLIGFDVVMHMAEEMPRPAKDIPRAMIYAVAVGGVTGTVFVLVSLFCFWDPDTFFATSTGIAVSELLLQATRSRAGATVLNLLLSVCFINGTIASITSASRLLWSMARDDGIFYAKLFGKIKYSLDVPVYTILFTGIFNILFGLLYLGPVVAFSAYISSCTLFLNVSYAFPVLVLLIRGRAVLDQYRYPGVPHQLGKWGYLVNYVAALFVTMTTVLFSFPIALPVDSNNMNYVVVVIGIFLLFVGVFWFTRGKQFKGPDFDAIIRSNVQVMQGDEAMAPAVPDSKEATEEEAVRGSQKS